MSGTNCAKRKRRIGTGSEVAARRRSLQLWRSIVSLAVDVQHQLPKHSREGSSSMSGQRKLITFSFLCFFMELGVSDQTGIPVVWGQTFVLVLTQQQTGALAACSLAYLCELRCF